MTSCERCWSIAKLRGVPYEQQLRDADVHQEPCIRSNEQAARLRAGHFWDEDTKCDSRSGRAHPLRSVDETAE